MNVMVCLDDNSGIAFGNMRQSRDKLLIRDAVKTAKDARLYVSEYSAPLFENYDVTVCGTPPVQAAKGDFYFAEQTLDGLSLPKAESIIIYYWNRVYPADVYFDFDLQKNGYKLAGTSEFQGYSHEKITKEVWVK